MKNFIFIIGCLVTPLCFASDGWFVEVSVGKSNVDYDVGNASSLDITGDIASVLVDDSDTGVSINVGYKINPKWQVAFGYTDLGTASLTANIDSVDFTSDVQEFLGTGPLLTEGFTFGTQFELIAKDKLSVDGEFGLYRWDADLVSFSETGRTAGNEDATDLYWGLRVLYDLDEHWTLHAGYKRFQLESHISYPNLGLSYSF